MTTFADFERHLLVGAYLTMEETGDEYLRIRDITDRFGLDYRPGWIMRALRSLIESGLSDDVRHLGGDDLDQSVSLTPHGYKTAEELENFIVLQRRPAIAVPSTETQPGRPEPAVEIEEIPASDRIVTIDHNSPAVAEIRDGVEELNKHIRRGNDIGDLSPDEANAAANEVYQIGLFFDADAVRSGTVLEFAKRSLKWIADKAGGALIGAMALALWALIKAFFGG